MVRAGLEQINDLSPIRIEAIETIPQHRRLPDAHFAGNDDESFAGRDAILDGAQRRSMRLRWKEQRRVGCDVEGRRIEAIEPSVDVSRSSRDVGYSPENPEIERSLQAFGRDDRFSRERPASRE